MNDEATTGLGQVNDTPDTSDEDVYFKKAEEAHFEAAREEPFITLPSGFLISLPPKIILPMKGDIACECYLLAIYNKSCRSCTILRELRNEPSKKFVDFAKDFWVIPIKRVDGHALAFCEKKSIYKITYTTRFPVSPEKTYLTYICEFCRPSKLPHSIKKENKQYRVEYVKKYDYFNLPCLVDKYDIHDYSASIEKDVETQKEVMAFYLDYWQYHFERLEIPDALVQLKTKLQVSDDPNPESQNENDHSLIKKHNPDSIIELYPKMLDTPSENMKKTTKKESQKGKNYSIKTRLNVDKIWNDYVEDCRTHKARSKMDLFWNDKDYRAKIENLGILSLREFKRVRSISRTTKHRKNKTA
jgi:hypothetical protein